MEWDTGARPWCRGVPSTRAGHRMCRGTRLNVDTCMAPPSCGVLVPVAVSALRGAEGSLKWQGRKFSSPFCCAGRTAGRMLGAVAGGGGGLVTAVGVLGPLVVVNGAGPVPVPGRAGALLALLTASYPYPTDRDALVEAVWPMDRPATAVNTLQVHVSGLRKLLGRAAVVREGNGYRLAVDAGQVDAHRFLRLVQEAETLRQPAARSARLVEALGLWRGPAYVGFEDVDVA